MVFVMSLYQLTLRSYGPVSTDMQKQMYFTKFEVYVMVIYSYKWPHKNCFVSHMKFK